MLDTLLKSNTYKRFSKQNLVNFQKISTIKARCMTYLYNNNKLCKIVKIQYEKNDMKQKIRLIKDQLQSWNKKYPSGNEVQNLRNTTLFNLQDEDNDFERVISRHHSLIGRTQSLKMNEETRKNMLSSLSEYILANENMQDTDSVSNSNITGLANMSKALIKDSNHVQLEEELLNELEKKHLNWITRALNWMKRYYSNQLLLVSTSSRLEAIEERLKSGRHRINTTLENKLLMRHYISNNESREEKRLNKLMPLRYNSQNHDYSDEKKQRLNRFQYATIISVIASNTSILCYLFMLI